VGVGGLFHETDLGQELNMIDLNCTGTVHLAKYIVRDMVRRDAGKILFTASIAGEMVAPREAVYAATKAFVLSFAHSLRYELRNTGVGVTALQPGPRIRSSSTVPGWTTLKSVLKANQRASLTTLRVRGSMRCSQEKTTFTQHLSRPNSKECWQT
jgi:short-subunit dehydrogenase